MLARVSSGKDGIVDYLVNGVKSGRTLNRDELDHRVCIDGSLTITDEIIKGLNAADKDNNYLHITLSFGERQLSEDKIIAAYDAYKNAIMKAYHTDEYNVYAEIHYPKVKSYADKKTGETIERFPHIHMVIPQKNLVTDKALNPFGRYTSNIDYHDSIQESVNRSLNLESPYDHQRKYRLNQSKSEFISRYKGDEFKGSQAALKKEIFNAINEKDIRTLEDFAQLLSAYGEVSKGKAGSMEEYFTLKPEGHSKNIRLKEPVFKPAYIQDRELQRPKPSDAKVQKLLTEWTDTRCHEMKHIHPAGEKTRKTYYELEPSEQQEFLDDYTRKYDTEYNLTQERRQASEQPRTERIGLSGFTDIAHGLPSVPQRGLVRADRERAAVSKSVLPSHADHHLESTRTHRDHQLRWSSNRSRRRGFAPKLDSLLKENHRLYSGQEKWIASWNRGKLTQGLPSPLAQIKPKVHPVLKLKPTTISESLLQEHLHHQTHRRQIECFRIIKKDLEPERILAHFEKTHGLIRKNYSTFRAKDGSARIKIGTIAFNLSDFATKHMHQSWNQTQEILKHCYRAQRAEQEESSGVSLN